MAFPKKHTHIITVGGIVYLWHRSRKWDAHTRWTAIRQQGIAGQLLLLDPYHHDLSFGAGAIRLAIDWALAHGWTPERANPPMKLRYNGDATLGDLFTVLPANARPGTGQTAT